MQRAIERVRGFSDTSSAGFQQSDGILQSLKTSFSLAGYSMVDVPILEHLELYMRKSGAQMLSKLYGFVDQGRREVALRPEFTASIIRALAPSVERALEPVRVAYAGPVFRYEKPQRATTRQFNQVGVELLGEPSPSADADILALACQTALDAGVDEVHAVVGHLGPLRALLAHLDVDGYAEGYLLEHLEFYNRGPEQQSQVRRQLGFDDEGPDSVEEGDPTALADALATLSPDAAREVVSGLLRQMGVALDGNTRSPEEIIERVLGKAQRHAAARSGARKESLERALQFCASLSELRGVPSRVLADAEALLRTYDVPLSALDDLREVMALFEQHGLARVRVTLAPGMARGIAYYSGLIFELYARPKGASSDVAELQICGGGRYDGLPLAITGRQSFPALGFAFGLERLAYCVPAATRSANLQSRIAIAAGSESRAAGLRLARELRRAGHVTIFLDAEMVDGRFRDRLRRAGYAALVVPHLGTTAEAEIEKLDPAVPSQVVDDVRRIAASLAEGSGSTEPVATLQGGLG